jgi:threonine dehydrogenase-like Zn-dependent dehydrogenase
MRATVMYAAGDVRIENVPDPQIEEPTDAIIRVVRASDLRQRPLALQRPGPE